MSKNRLDRLLRFPGTVREGLSKAKAFELEQGRKVASRSGGFRGLYYRPADGDFNIFVGDTVHILAGRDKGKVGIVRDIFWQKRWLYVTGRNTSLQSSKQESGMVYFHEEQPLKWHEVALVDHSDDKPCITELAYLEDGTPTRTSTRTGTVLPLPPEVEDTPGVPGYKDTDPKLASERTYVVNSKTFADSVLESDLQDPVFKTLPEGTDPIVSAIKFQQDMQRKKRKEAEK